MGSSLAEMIVSLCKTSRPQESFPSYLIDDSRETKWAWDALNLVTQDLAPKGKTPSPRTGRMDRRRAGGPICEEGAETAAPTG